MVEFRHLLMCLLGRGRMYLVFAGDADVFAVGRYGDIIVFCWLTKASDLFTRGVIPFSDKI